MHIVSITGWRLNIWWINETKNVTHMWWNSSGERDIEGDDADADDDALRAPTSVSFKRRDAQFERTHICQGWYGSTNECSDAELICGCLGWLYYIYEMENHHLESRDALVDWYALPNSFEFIYTIHIFERWISGSVCMMCVLCLLGIYYICFLYLLHQFRLIITPIVYSQQVLFESKFQRQPIHFEIKYIFGWTTCSYLLIRLGERCVRSASTYNIAQLINYLHIKPHFFWYNSIQNVK